MKTTMLTKAMMAVLFAMTSVLTLNAAKPVKITNEEVENGRVSAKVVYEQEGTFLTPEYRFEFRYNDKGQIIEKKSMKWNGTDWINYYCMDCLADYLGCTVQDILDKIEEFKEEGCKLFS
mgnify:CR=1 FL=1